MKILMTFLLLISSIHSLATEDCNNVFVTLRDQDFTRSAGVNGDYLIREINLRKKAGAISAEATVSDSAYLLITKWSMLVDSSSCNFDNVVTVEQFEKAETKIISKMRRTFRDRSSLLQDTHLTKRGCYSQGLNSAQNMFCKGLSSPASCIRAGRVSGCYWIP